MPAQKRFKTKYPGVYYIQGKAIGLKGDEKIYYIMYRKDGKLIEEKAGRQFIDDMTPSRASQARAQRIHGDQLSNKERRELNEAQKSAEAHKWTIERLWDSYQEHNPTLKGWATYKSAYKLHVRKAFGKKEPRDILPLDITRVKNRLLKTHSPQTVQHVLELLRRLISFGVNNKLCKGVDFRIQMPKVHNTKTEDLTPDQLSRLLAAIEGDSHPCAGTMMHLALFTGMRRGEMFKLQWQNIDCENGFIDIVDPKGGADQKIPLNAAARQLLEAHPKTGSQYVFPGLNGGQRSNIGKQVARIKKAAGLPKDFRPLHGLRHVYASMLASSGQVDLYTLQKLLTHKSPLMTQRYAHLRDDALKRASNVASEIINNISKEENKVKELTRKGRS